MPQSKVTKKLDATTGDQTYTFTVTPASIHILNQGSNDVQIEYDTAVTADSTYISAGDQFAMSFDFPPQTGRVYPTLTTLHYKAVASTTTLYLTVLGQD